MKTYSCVCVDAYHFFVLCRTPLEIATVQWINQSFNALVNYTNRNAKSEITGKCVRMCEAILFTYSGQFCNIVC